MLSMGDVFCGLMMIDGCIWYCYHYYMSDGEYHYKDAGANILYTLNELRCQLWYHYKDAGANITYHIARGMKWRTEDIFTESCRKSGG